MENLYERGQMTDAEYAVLSEWFNFLVTCPQLDFGIDHIIYLRYQNFCDLSFGSCTYSANIHILLKLEK